MRASFHRRVPHPPGRLRLTRAGLGVVLVATALPLAAATSIVPAGVPVAAAATDADTCIATRGDAAGGSLGEVAVHISTVSGQRIGATHRALAFSPDGTRILWMDLQRPNGVNEYALVTSAIDGSDKRKVYIHTSAESLDVSQEYVWSPDGRHVAFIVHPGLSASDRLKIIDVTATATVAGAAAFTSSFKTGTGFDFSPDGSKLVFTDGSGTFENDLWVVNANGTNPVRILDDTASNSSLPPWNPPKDIEDIRWSPDGTTIAFAARNGISQTVGGVPVQTPAYWELYLIDPDGTDLRMIPLISGQPDDSRRYPTWSPDSKKLAFTWSRSELVNSKIVQSNGIAVHTIAAGTTVNLTNATDWNSYPSGRMEWSPSANAVITAATYWPPVTNTGEFSYGVYIFPVDGSPKIELESHATQASLTRGLVSLVPCSVVRPGVYDALVPARLLDTRPGYPTADGQFAGIGAAAAGSVIELQVTGRGGVPADASAVVLNVAVTGAQAPGYVTAYPCGSDRPTAANLNYGAGDTIPNLVIAKIGAGGKVCLYTYATTDLIADVNGAFGPGTNYLSLNPARVLETRPGYTTADGSFNGIGLQPAGSVLELQVAGRADVPLDATAVVLNVAVTQPEGPGYITVFPCGSDRPTAANLNYAAGDTIPNLVIAKIGVGGKVCLYTYAATHLIADVNGAFPSGTSYVPLVPARLYDSRPGQPIVDGTNGGASKRSAGSVTKLRVINRAGVQNDASAVVLNIAVTEAEADGFLTVYPCDAPRPTAANLNYGAGDTIPNLVVSGVSEDGEVCIYTYARTHLVIDVNGSFPDYR